MDDPWPYKGKTNYLFPQDHGYQYRGYFLNPQKRPTFMYRYGEIAVEDFFEDELDGKGEAFFRRNITFTAPAAQESFFFRVGAGKQISSTGGGKWQLDRLSLHVPEGHKGIVREGDPQDLLLELALPKGKTVLKLEYRW